MNMKLDREDRTEIMWALSDSIEKMTAVASEPNAGDYSATISRLHDLRDRFSASLDVSVVK